MTPLHKLVFHHRNRAMLLNIASLMIASVFLFPLYWIFTSSLKGDAEIFRNPPTLFPQKIFFNGYIDQLQGPYSILLSAQNSFIQAFGAMIISFILSVPAAYGISRFQLPGTKTMIMAFLVTQMLPASLLLTPLFLMFSKLGLLNTRLAPILAVTTITIPFTMLVLRPMFMAYPASIEEAARIDGCSRFSAFIRVVLPIIKPGLVTVLCFGFVHGWNNLVYPLTFNNKNALYPMTASIYKLMNEYGLRWNWVMAYGCMLVLPPLIIFILAQKYIITGMVGGAVKA
ncbi:MAG TPA: carbohydrate ABC transporter permease [Clostridia bacterium]